MSTPEPAIPGELWMLWVEAFTNGAPCNQGWLAQRNRPGGGDRVVFFTESEAREESAQLQTIFGLICRPVRVK